MLVVGFAVTAMLTVLAGRAPGVSGGSISPTTLSSSGQKFEIKYSGRTASDQGGASLVVEECIADDKKAGFDPGQDCSSLSQQSFYGVPESGTVIYGGNPGNPTAPFVGTDPENGAWSLCGGAPGVSNHQSGFLRLAESPTDTATDFFVPFTCAAAGARGTANAAKTGGSGGTGVVLAAGAGVVALAAIFGLARKRRRTKSSSPSH